MFAAGFSKVRETMPLFGSAYTLMYFVCLPDASFAMSALGYALQSFFKPLFKLVFHPSFLHFFYMAFYFKIVVGVFLGGNGS